MHNVVDCLPVRQGESSSVLLEESAIAHGSGQTLTCRRCGSDRTVGNIDGPGPLCVECARWVIHSLLNLESRL